MANIIQRGRLSKRTLLRGLGVAALAAFEDPLQALAAGTYAAEYPVDPAQTFDAIVVGAGTAGIPLAIHGARRGKILVIEKSGQIGGTLFISGGLMSAAGTRLQARKGIKDTAQLHYDDTMRLAHNKANPPVLRRFVDNAGAAYDWLEDIGFTVRPDHPVTGTSHADFRVARYQQGPDGGRSILKAMLPEFLKAEATGNLRVLMRTGVVELTKSADGAVTGVIVEDESRKRTQYRARNVVLTSGGCLMNPAMFERLNYKPLYARRVYPYSMGQGIDLGLSVGGHVSGGDMYITHRGVIMTDRNYPAPVFASIASSLDPRYRMPWEIEVNRNGERFIAEDADLDRLERAQTVQPGMSSILVWDQEIYDKAPPIFPAMAKEQQNLAFETQSFYAKGGTLEEVARKLGIPAAALTRTVSEYNASVAAKSDRLGRKHLPLPIAKPPFYAVECLGSSLFGHAGLDIDGDLRVITADRKPIKNLYAAGEVTGGWHNSGDVVVNGCMVTPAITFGRLLGARLLPFA